MFWGWIIRMRFENKQEYIIPIYLCDNILFIAFSFSRRQTKRLKNCLWKRQMILRSDQSPIILIKLKNHRTPNSCYEAGWAENCNLIELFWLSGWTNSSYILSTGKWIELNVQEYRIYDAWRCLVTSHLTRIALHQRSRSPERFNKLSCRYGKISRQIVPTHVYKTLRNRYILFPWNIVV